MNLADFDPATFLRDHWQRTPLLIRNPWSDWRNPVDPDTLAGLACDSDVESRLVRRTKKTWKVDHGPFKPKRFTHPPKHPWTLLVQAVDHAVPAVAALLDAFAFVPNWRVDDVMVSYATDGGGVGPHFDQYDVFLIQGLGTRRWRVGQRCDAATPLLPHDDLRLLSEFEANAEYLLGPGDILYLPPGFAHDGVAIGDDCMTYSVGFRAPSRAELVGGWADDLLDRFGDDDRYTDPGLALQANPGEIATAALDDLHAMVVATLGNRAAFARWFGRHATTPKTDLDWAPDEAVTAAEIRARLAASGAIVSNPASRFAFTREVDSVTLFVDGEAYDCYGDTATLAEALCAGPRLLVQVPDAALDLLVALIAHGSLTIE